jgi:sporulation protein YlmC with PRC-barrel domain
MSKTMGAMAFAVMMAAGMAIAGAQTATPTPPSPTLRAAMTTNHLVPGQIRVTEMTGAAVYDSQNQKIGSIRDIILDGDGRVGAVVLNVSGTLGIGGRYVAVGINDLKITNADGKPRFAVDMLKDQLRTAQTFDLNEATRTEATTPPPPPPDDRTPPPADPER